MFCEKCGSEIKDDNVYCPICGAKIEDIYEVKITDDNKTLNSAREFEKRLNSGGTQTQNELTIRFKRNKAATAFNVVAWLIMCIGGIIGIIIILYSFSKSGSNSYTSVFGGLGSGVGIIVVVASFLSSLGFFAVGEIIQLLEDQKTIMLNNSKWPIK